ncbi:MULTISPECIES: Crp/Fnr family transcriptional regulator [unclassified Beijerinckia]|uniref:Crp/Fnr family transcriptional regulator n=1 Tax=unclassified Beijerinckia TaxID=2638183 RepID=UPI000899ABE0|nr:MULTISPECIES: Crp/Fnr family transcriptional regulator [unclassified Beijerinckia]MDH7799187.1 CRP/FNR family transcriptional regulator [Beijerinckia sp. GAS462]SED92517.1 CRP/FNR family transcriptional regulator, anaerobic regulatory protein [Beijerinckia sp. 28-YEA-48]
MKTAIDSQKDQPCGAPHAGCYECSVRSISVCAALSREELHELENLSRPEQFAPRQALFLQGDAVDSVFNVTSGCFRLVNVLHDGRRQIMGFALPGDFLGLSSDLEYGVSAESLGPASICRFNKAAFSSYLSRKTSLLTRLLDYAGHELSLAHEQMALLGRRSAEERVVSFLLGLRKRNERFGRQGVTLHLAMPRQDIADYLGLTIETVSRVMTHLAREKLIVVVPDGVRFLQMERLQSLTAVDPSVSKASGER